MKKTTKKSLRHIPTGRLARGFKLARLTASMGVDHIGTKVASVFRGRIQKEAAEVLFQIGQARNGDPRLERTEGRRDEAWADPLDSCRRVLSARGG